MFNFKNKMILYLFLMLTLNLFNNIDQRVKLTCNKDGEIIGKNIFYV
jgi:hypothetical protein